MKRDVMVKADADHRWRLVFKSFMQIRFTVKSQAAHGFGLRDIEANFNVYVIFGSSD